MAGSLGYTQEKNDSNLRLMWKSLIIFALLELIILSLATQFIASQLGYSSKLGAPVFGHFYMPYEFFFWMFKFDTPTYGKQVMEIFSGAQLILGVGSILVVIGILILNGRKKQTSEGLHGTAHWASKKEVEATKMLPAESNAGGVMFGHYSNNNLEYYLRHKGPEHMMVFAPTRSGKGVGIVIPTLLSWDQSVLVHDIKGENWALTSGFREKVLGQKCLRFSPAEYGSARFNPLKEIRLDHNMVKDVQNIATMIVDPDGKGLSDHWAKTGFDLMTGVLIFVLLSKEYEDNERSLASVQAILSDGGRIKEIAEREAALASADSDAEALSGIQAVMTYIKNTANYSKANCTNQYELTGWDTVAQATQSFLNKAPNEASGVLSTALSFLALYRDPIVAENTSFSDFTIEDLVNSEKPMSLYLVVPPSDKDRLKPLLRLILNQVVRRLAEKMEFTQTGEGKGVYKHKLLLLIDEFPALGKLDVFQESLAFIAGYGMKALLIVQDISQLHSAYGKDESIMSNCHIRIAYAPNKIETAKVISDMCGVTTVVHQTQSYSGGRNSLYLGNMSTSDQQISRPLLTPDECLRLPPEDEIVYVAGHAPIKCKKIIYYKDEAFIERVKIGQAESTGHPEYKKVIKEGVVFYAKNDK